MTHEEFNKTCKEQCQYCGKEHMGLRQREDTREWVHDWAADQFGGRQGHAYCAASPFRNEWKDKIDG